MCRIVFLFSFIFLTVSNAQERQRIELETSFTGEIGSSFVYKVKEEFRKSAFFELVGKEDESRKIKLIISTTDKKCGYQDSYYMETIVSLVYLMDIGKYSDHKCFRMRYDYLTSTQFYTFGDNLQSTAEYLIAYTFKIIEDLDKNGSLKPDGSK